MAYPRDMSIAQAIKQYGLPKNHRAHWSRARKAGVVRAVHEQAISFHEARERYLLSRSEFEEWERDFSRGSSDMRTSQLESV
ncbi:DUF1153 domain-containing protein [uncultured Erythrobacter sp.]|uniref:DUF1153 domain-containing protein n=1 Tax=uncultured Erythrobacter sp. TaxID=263913 RepID=UPI0026350D98|nr:DUF1153 domain-containing protein [uncultured Erythrobacter sp.]